MHNLPPPPLHYYSTPMPPISTQVPKNSNEPQYKDPPRFFMACFRPFQKLLSNGIFLTWATWT